MPAPKWLPSAAKKLWNTIAPSLLESGQLNPATIDVLGQWCCVTIELRVLAATIAREGSIVPGLHGNVISAATLAAGKARGTLASLTKCLAIDPAAANRLAATKPEPAAVNAVEAFIATRHRPEPGTPEEEEAREADLQIFAASVGMK